MIQDKKLTSETIIQLRFPLMLGVVLLHSNIGDCGMPVCGKILNLFSVNIVAPCVPLFFFLSGYLFFYRNQESFTFNDYKNKLERRAKSLLIPYIFWNAVVLLYFAIMHGFIPSLINPEFNNVYKYSATEWIRSFWDFPGNQPICYQFWFIRDLMVMTLMTPIIFLIVKYGKIFVPILLMSLYIYNTNLIPHQGVLTYFTIGASFSVNQYDFVLNCKKIWTFCLLAFGLTIILQDKFKCHELLVISGSCLYIYIATLSIEKIGRIKEFYTSSSFFMYAFHGFPVIVIGKVIVKVVSPSTILSFLICYVGCFTITILLSLLLFFICSNTIPQITKIIIGGR